MKTIAFLFLLLSATAFAQSKTDDYSVIVHVAASRIAATPQGHFSQRLKATIDGKKYELEYVKQFGGVSLLRIGDYRARLIDNPVSNSYELNQVCEFKLAYGKTRKFEVVGMEE